MSGDPDGAAAFYGPVAGWTRADAPGGRSGGVDYRMIVRSDGGNAGGVLKLSDEMQQGGARPCWMGYLSVEDVDAKVAAIESEGGKALMPPMDLPGGRIAMVNDPQGVPLYVLKRSEERRGGTECVSTSRSRGAP